jgi:amidase
MSLSPEWKFLVEEKRVHLKARIPPSWVLPEAITEKVDHTANVNAFDLLDVTNLLTAQEKEITEKYTATALIRLMCEGKFTSVQVTTAFCKRAAIAQQLVSECLSKSLEDSTEILLVM